MCSFWDGYIQLLLLFHLLLVAYMHLYMAREQARGSFHFEEKTGRRLFLTFLACSGAMSAASPSLGKTKKQTPYDERRLLEQNKRIQRENNVPDDFPSFLREGSPISFSVIIMCVSLYYKKKARADLIFQGCMVQVSL